MSAPTPISPRTSPRSSGVKQMSTEEGFDPIAYQIGILKELASSNEANPRQLQAVYQSTIMLCLTNGKEKEAIELLNDSEADQIFAGADPETRAKLFSAVICKLIENGLHNEGHVVYKSFGVWDDQSDHYKKAKSALVEVGFRL